MTESPPRPRPVQQRLARATRRRARKYLRQFELVERVRAYDPVARREPDQPRLRLRDVQARQPEAPLRRPVFRPPDRGRGHPHRVQARRRDHRRGPAARHDRRHRRHARRDRANVRRRRSPIWSRASPSSRKLEIQSEENKQAQNLQKFILAMSRDVRVLIVKLADRLHNMRTLQHMPNAGQAPPHRDGDAGNLRAAGAPHRHGEDGARAGEPRLPRSVPGSGSRDQCAP